MDTDIRFLEDLREDLQEVAWRETLGREPEARRGRRGHARGDATYRRPRRRLVLVAGLAAFLTLAGAIGWFVMRGSGVGPFSKQEQIKAVGGVPHAMASPAPNGFGVGAPGNDQQVTLQERASLTFGAFNDAATAPSTAQGNPQDLAQSVVGITTPTDLTRIVKTGQLSVVVDRGMFDDKFRAAGVIAAHYKGYVQSSSTSGGKSGTLVIRVPVARFEFAMSDLAALGVRIESQSVTGKNVTADFVDLNARLRVWQDDQRILNGLLDKATTPEQILRYTSSIMDVQFKIESLKGELRVLKNETDMSTIKFSLRESGVPVATTNATKVKNPSLASAWAHAVAGFLGVVFAVTVGLGYLIPISVLLVIGWFVWRRARRRAIA